jgi:hypothetical protein
MVVGVMLAPEIALEVDAVLTGLGIGLSNLGAEKLWFDVEGCQSVVTIGVPCCEERIA